MTSPVKVSSLIDYKIREDERGNGEKKDDGVAEEREGKCLGCIIHH